MRLQLLLCAALYPLCTINVFAQLQFREITTEAGITHSFSHAPEQMRNELVMAGGAVAEDFNGDGFLDLYVLQGGEFENRLYINNGDGTFTDEAAQRGAAIQDAGMGAAAADYDNDGDVDIFFTTLVGPHYLLTNDGSGFFSVDTNAITGLGINAMSPSWGDIDNDGLLDLSIGLWQEGRLGNLYLFHNQGGNEFVPIEFHEEEFTDKYVFSARFADVNNDRLQDLLVAADYGNSQLYLNQGNLKFKRVTATNGTGSDENGMGSAVGDYDNDGDLDWFVSSIWDDTGDDGRGTYTWGITGNRFYQNQGNGSFVDRTDATHTRDGNWGWGASFGDLNNDGGLDLYHVNGWLIGIQFNNPFSHIYRFHDRPARLFLNNNNGTFTETAASAGADHTGQGRGSLLFDYDNDGDLDIFICNSFDVDIQNENAVRIPAKPALLQNVSATTNHWVKAILNGTPPYHSQGIGSRIYVTTGGATQMRELHASSNFLAQEAGSHAHFGLGAHSKADELRVVWNNGDEIVLEDVDAGQTLTCLSPYSTLSKRNVQVGETVLTSSGTAPQNWVQEWIVEGQPQAPPLIVKFLTPGIKTIQVNYYDQSTQQKILAERFHVTVSETPTGVQNFLLH